MAMPGTLRRVLWVGWKELAHIRRDPLTLALMIGLPTLWLVVYGYGVSTDVKHARLAIVDLDRSQASRALIGKLGSSDLFEVRMVASPEESATLLDASAVHGTLILPRGYGSGSAGTAAQRPLVTVDGSDGQRSTVLYAYLATILATNGPSVSGAATHAIPEFLRIRIWYNPDLSSQLYFLPGLIGVLLVMLCSVLTALTLSGELERGSLEQLRVTPVTAAELVIGKLLPYVTISFIDYLLILVFAYALFGLVTQGSFLALSVSTLILIASALALGMMASAIAPSQAVAVQMAYIAALLPSFILSGFIFPISSMPVAMQWLTELLPIRHFTTLVRAIMLKGTGFGDHTQEMLVMTALTVALLVAATARMRRVMAP